MNLLYALLFAWYTEASPQSLLMQGCLELHEMKVAVALAYGADAKCLFGRLYESPLHCAIQRVKTAADAEKACRIVDLLINHGCKVSHETIYKETALEYAVGKSFLVTDHLMRQHLISIDLPNSDGDTVSHRLIYQALENILDQKHVPKNFSIDKVQKKLQYLYEMGADFTTQNKAGKTIFDLGQDSRELKIMLQPYQNRPNN